MKIAVTGHRPHKLNNEYDYEGPCSKFIKEQLKKHLQTLGATQGITGMALGSDTIFSQVCLELNIPLLAAIPFVGQEKKWPSKSQKLYWEIIKNPLTTLEVGTNGYSKAAFQKRNEFMVDSCDKLIAVYDGTLGGTHNAVRYAQSIEREIILINPQDFNKTTDIQGTLFG